MPENDLLIYYSYRKEHGVQMKFVGIVVWLSLKIEVMDDESVPHADKLEAHGAGKDLPLELAFGGR